MHLARQLGVVVQLAQLWRVGVRAPGGRPGQHSDHGVSALAIEAPGDDRGAALGVGEGRVVQALSGEGQRAVGCGEGGGVGVMITGVAVAASASKSSSSARVGGSSMDSCAKRFGWTKLAWVGGEGVRGGTTDVWTTRGDAGLLIAVDGGSLAEGSGVTTGGGGSVIRCCGRHEKGIALTGVKTERLTMRPLPR